MLGRQMLGFCCTNWHKMTRGGQHLVTMRLAGNLVCLQSSSLTSVMLVCASCSVTAHQCRVLKVLEGLPALTTSSRAVGQYIVHCCQVLHASKLHSASSNHGRMVDLAPHVPAYMTSLICHAAGLWRFDDCDARGSVDADCLDAQLAA